MPEVEKIQAVQKAEFEAEQAKLAAVEGKAACGCGAGENAADSADLEPMDVEAKEEITFDDFEKLQFQVGEIVKCEAVAEVKEASLLTGKDWKPDKADSIRHQKVLFS